MTRIEEMTNKLIKEGGTKSNLFWKLRKQAIGKKNDTYETISEGVKIENPEVAKDHIANLLWKPIPSTRGKGIAQTMDRNNTTTSNQHIQHQPHNSWRSIWGRTKQNNQNAEKQQSHRPRSNTKWNLHQSRHKNETNMPKNHKQNNTNIKHLRTMARRWNNQTIQRKRNEREVLEWTRDHSGQQLRKSIWKKN